MASKVIFGAGEVVAQQLELAARENVIRKHLPPIRLSTNDLIAASIHDDYDFDVSEGRNRTVVYLEFIYTRKIDKNICQNSIRPYSS